MIKFQIEKLCRIVKKPFTNYYNAIINSFKLIKEYKLEIN